MLCAKNYVGTPFLNLHVQGSLLTAALSRSTFRTPEGNIPVLVLMINGVTCNAIVKCLEVLECSIQINNNYYLYF